MATWRAGWVGGLVTWRAACLAWRTDGR